MSRLRYFIPFLLLFSLLGFLGYELFHAKPNELPSTMIGEKVPDFRLQTLSKKGDLFTQQSLQGHVSLLNVFATWCYACTLEHDMLIKINREYHVPVYGLLYKDDAKKTIDWLNQHGNPYTKIGDDNNGDTAIDFGVYGTPETFVISKEGRIVYRHIGMIDQETWDKVLSPLIKKLNA